MSLPKTLDNQSVTITDSATIAQADALRDRLAIAAAQGLDVVVACEPSEIDVTTIQLLIATNRSLEARGGSLRLAGPPSGAFLDALIQGGFINHGKESALWATGVSR